MNVLVSGAGIAGPVAAFFISKLGHHVTIVEKAKSILTHGQNIDLNGSAFTVIKQMGLEEELKRWNSTEIGTRFVTNAGRTFASFPLNKEGPSISPTSPNEILRGDLARILFEATTNLPRVKYLFDTTINGVTQKSENAVTVQLNNGQTSEYDLLVIADGQWSKTRSLCFSPEEVATRDINMFAVYWTVPRQPDDERYWDLTFAGKSRILSTRPDPHGTTRAMFSYVPRTQAEKQKWHEAARSDRMSKEKLLHEAFADAGWKAPRLLSEMVADDFYFQELKQIKMSSWSKGRVVLLGDAAYCPTPVSGSGCTAAITGAYCLAGEVSKLDEGQHPSSALKEYEKVLRPFIENLQNVPLWAPSLLHAQSWYAQICVQLLLATLAMVAQVALRIPPVRRSLDIPSEADDDGFPLPYYETLVNPASARVS